MSPVSPVTDDMRERLRDARGFIFDMDGTLLPTFAQVISSWEREHLLLNV